MAETRRTVTRFETIMVVLGLSLVMFCIYSLGRADRTVSPSPTPLPPGQYNNKKSFDDAKKAIEGKPYP